MSNDNTTPDPTALEQIDEQEVWEQSGDEITEEMSDDPAVTGEIDGD